MILHIFFSVLFPDLKPIVDKFPVPLVAHNIYDFFKTTVDAILKQRKNDPSVSISTSCALR